LRVERKVRSGLFVLVLAVATAGTVAADDVVETSTESSLVVRGGAPAMRAYADPETGELVAPDGADIPNATGSGAGETAALEIVPAPTVGGGVMVDLRGHFRHETRAHVVDDKLAADCIPASSPP
jgi:hypothetical protein